MARAHGDIRFLGDANGILPLDRPHQVKVFGNYLFPFGLNVGIGVNVGSGKPLTAMDPNPNYGNGGEIPDTARGGGIQTIDGFKTRTPVQSQFDLQASYHFKVGGRNRICGDGGHVQPVQPADGPRLRQLDVDLVRRRAERQLRSAHVEPVRG